MLDNCELSQILFLDIETVPQFANYEDVPEHLKHLWDKKTAFQRKNAETAEEFYCRAGILAEFGKIVCITVGKFSGEGELKIRSIYGADESLILRQFCILMNNLPENIILCAHNGKEFDFPYLCRRLIINGVKIPKQLNISGKKPWEINHLDTMELWKFGDHKHYTSLNLLAAVLEIPSPKDDIDGSQVSEIYWKNQDLERIRFYCQKDVVTLARLIQKF